MKRIILSLTAFLFLIQLQAGAVISTDEAISEVYLINHGYSKETARLVKLQHAQINGEKYNIEGNDYTPFQQAVRNIFMYLDPALDSGKFGTHDIKYTNKWDQQL